MVLHRVAALLLLASLTQARDNGLALTPPRGWLSWTRYGCNTDCANDPNNCIGEQLLTQTAEIMVADGWLAAGYEYLMVDDCWPSKVRAADGQLQVEPARFPNGMKHLIDYVHSLGLKFGIYADVGTHTCAGYPGSQFFMELDISTFANWGVDLIKLDQCNIPLSQVEEATWAYGDHLNASSRNMLLSCEYPMPLWNGGIKFDPVQLQKTCNTWRMYSDISDNWDSVMGFINFWGADKPGMKNWAGPGHWNDADQLCVGGFGLSDDQERAQIAIWTMIGSPLYISADLRTFRESSRDLLQNPRVLSVSADPLGVVGYRIVSSGAQQIWIRSVSPKGSFAIVYLYTDTMGRPTEMSAQLSTLGLNNAGGYIVRDIFTDALIGKFLPADTMKLTVNPTGVQYVRATPL